MMDEKRVFIVLVFVIGGVIFLSFNSSFTGYSISEEKDESNLLLSNVLPGSTAKAELHFMINTDTLTYGKVLATGEAAAWIRFLDEKYVFLPETATDIPLYISVPEGTPEGSYEAKIALLSVDSEEGTPVFENAIVNYIPISIIVSQEKKELGFRISSFTVYDAEENGEVYFQADIENLGNTLLNKEIVLHIYTIDGILLATESIHSSFLAYEEKNIVSSFSETLEEGKYYAKLIAGEESKSTSFDIVEEGTLKRKGELLYLETSVQEDHLVTLTAYFTNTGDGVEYASLEGVVTNNGDTVHEFQSDSQVSLPEEYTIFSYSYSELLNGAYAVHAEISSGNVVLAEAKDDFYSSNAIRLESNVIVIISLVMLLLIVSHFILSRRKE